MSDFSTVLAAAIRAPLEESELPDLQAWWRAEQERSSERRASGRGAPGGEAAVGAVTGPFTDALLGGLHADRPGYAFAAGYRAALQALVPALDATVATALCVTEEGPPHPRHIATRAERDGAATVLRGSKSFVTLGPLARELLVLARVEPAGTAPSATTPPGESDRLIATALFRIPATAPGVRMEPMPPLPFVPEIPHARVILDGVVVAPDQRLPGDGWSAHVRPFRTVEDIHVHVALLGHGVRLLRLHGAPVELTGRISTGLAALASLSVSDPSAPSTHLALAGVIESGQTAIEEVAALLPEGEVRRRWQRDRPLLQVASRARQARLQKARQRLGLP